MKQVLRIISRIVQWLLLLSLLVAAVPVLLIGVLRSPAARDAVKHEISAVLERELHMRATFADVDFAPLSLAVVAKGISVDHPSQGRLIDAGELRIRPSLRALLRGHLDLHAVTIDHATLFLKMRDGQLVNLPDLPKSSEPASDTIELPFSYFTLSDTRVLLDAAEDGAGELSKIHVHVDASDEGVIAVDAKIGDGFLRHRRGEELLHEAELRAQLSKGRIAIEHAHVKTQDAEVRVERGMLPFPVSDKAYEGQVDARLRLPALARVPGADHAPSLRGEVHVRGDVKGAGKALSGHGQVLLSRVYIDQFGLAELVTMDVSANAKELSFDARFDAIDKGGRLDLQGSVALTEGFPLKVAGRARGVEFAKLMKQLGVSDNAIVDWLLDGRFELSGPLSPLALRGPMHFDTHDFQITKEAYHQLPHSYILHIGQADLDGTVRVTEDGITFIDVDATMPHTRLEVAEVLLGFDNALRVRAQGAEVDLRDVTPLLDFGLDGQGSFDVDVTGTFTEPIVSGTADFKRFAFAGFPFGDLETKYHLENDSQAVRFTDVGFVKGDSRYNTDSLFLDFSDGRLLVESQLYLERLHMADFYRIFHYDQDERFESYQGTLTGIADLHYTLGFPEDSATGTLKTDMKFAMPEVSLDGYAFTDGEFEGSWYWYNQDEGYQGGVLTVDRFTLRKGKGTASVSGTLKRGGVLDFVVLGDRMSIEETEGLGDRFQGLTGTYGVIGNIKGPLATPHANLDLVGTDLRYKGSSLGESRAYVRLTDKQDPWIVEANGWPEQGDLGNVPCGYGRRGFARGQWPSDPPIRTLEGLQPALEQPMAWVVCGSMLDGRMQIDMAVGRTKVMPLRGRVMLHDVAYGRFLPRGPDRAPLEGVATGSVEFTGGAVHDLETLAGQLHFTDLRVGQFDVQLKNEGPIHVEFSEGSLEVESAELYGTSSRLRISGGGSVEHGLSLTVNGDVDLSLLSHLGQTITESKGRLGLEFRVSGPLDAPLVFGKAEIIDAALRVGALPTPITDISGEVHFSEQRIMLENFRARVLGGQLSVSGSANLSGRGLGSYQLQVDGRGLSMEPKDEVLVRFGGHTEVAWKKGDRIPKLTGVLRLEEARYGRDIQVGRSIQDVYRKERTQVDGYIAEDDLLAIDLRVIESQPLRIENNLIDAELELDNQKQPFRVVGTDQRLGVLGNMSVKRGTLRFRDTEFAIRDGEFHFDDPTRIDPAFDLHAVTDVRRAGAVSQNIWHVSLHAWGNREDLRFDLASDPRLSEDDIALLLTLGMTHAELAQINTGDLTGTAALEALATVTGVEREMKRALPTIDDFRVQSAYSQRSNRTEPQLYIGKRIADRVRLSAATGVGAARDFRTGVELQVSDQTSVEAAYNNQNATTASQLGDVGVDLKWRLEFD